jgi:hypothetical protein
MKFWLPCFVSCVCSIGSLYMRQPWSVSVWLLGTAILVYAHRHAWWLDEY